MMACGRIRQCTICVGDSAGAIEDQERHGAARGRAGGADPGLGRFFHEHEVKDAREHDRCRESLDPAGEEVPSSDQCPLRVHRIPQNLAFVVPFFLLHNSIPSRLSPAGLNQLLIESKLLSIAVHGIKSTV